MTVVGEIEPFRLIKTARRLLRPATSYLENVIEKDCSEDLKTEAAVALGKIGDSSSGDVLLKVVDLFPDRIEPISALGFYRSGTPVPKLLKLLENPEHPLKEEIVRVLGEIGDPMAGKRLSELLRDQDRMVRYYAAWALYKIGGRDAAQSLCALLNDPDEWIVINVLEILSRLREVDAIPALVGQFKIARDSRLKAIIISSLATFAEPQLLSTFEEGLKSFDPRIQANAVEAISLLKIPQLELKRRLKQFFGHPNNRVRANVAIGLWKADEAKVLEEVESMINSSDPSTRRSAAYVLSKVELKGRDSFISRLLLDEVYGVRKMALKAALALSTSLGIERILPLLKDSSVWVRKEAVDCARKIFDFPTEAVLEAFKAEKTLPVWESMLDFIVEHHIDTAVSIIVQKIKDEPEEGLPKLLSSLGHLNAKDAIIEAKKFLGPATPETMREYYISLLHHGELSVFNDIAAALKDKTRDEEQSVFFNVTGEIGAFIQKTELFSQKLTQALAEEVAKDMQGVITLDTQPADEIKPESIKIGIDLFSKGKNDEAKQFFDKFLKKYPGNLDAVYYHAAILFKKGDHEKALPVLLELMERMPAHVSAGLLLGQIHFQKKNWEALRKLYEGLKEKIAKEDKKTMGQVHGALGLAYFHLKRYHKAIDVLNDAMKTNARDLSSCYHLALSYYAIKEHNQALKLLRELRTSLPNDSKVVRNVEELLQKLEDES